MAKKTSKASTVTESAPRASAEEFVTAWMRADSASEAAEMLGTSVASASRRATAYRKKGVELKKFSPGRGATIDVDALNALID